MKFHDPFFSWFQRVPFFLLTALSCWRSFKFSRFPWGSFDICLEKRSNRNSSSFLLGHARNFHNRDVVKRLSSRLSCGLGRLPSQISVIACRRGDWLQVRASHSFQKRSKSVYFHYNN